MVTTHLIPEDIAKRFEINEQRNATAILKEACPAEWADILGALRGFSLLKSELIRPGGAKSAIANRLDMPLIAQGWKEHDFATSIHVDGAIIDSPTHKVDCFKNRTALEVEWNNKDPFYDRDLNNFRLLFELRAIDVGVIVTRSDDLEALLKSLLGKGFGQSTTHMSKLVPRLMGGSGGGCPILVFGIGLPCYVDDDEQTDDFAEPASTQLF